MNQPKTESTPPQPLGALMIDIDGVALSADDRELLRHPAIGGVILFARNFVNREQLCALVADINSLRAPSLLIGVDQEGGRVQRFCDGFFRLPPLAIFGAMYDNDRAHALTAAELAGFVMAGEVRQTGVDASFAPVLDWRNQQSAVIGDRAFHHRADVVCELARAYIAGMNRAGMPATGKHFPGHGFVEADSHAELPRDMRTMRELHQRDLIPFAQLAQQLGAMMTAHVLFETIDDDLPTYSRYWLRDILRDELHFEGAILSDDLSMKGAGDEDAPTRAMRALTAGCDLALICNDRKSARAAADHLQDQHQSKRIESLRAIDAAPDDAQLRDAIEQLRARLAQVQ